MTELEEFVEWLKKESTYDYAEGDYCLSEDGENEEYEITGIDLPKFLNDKLKQWKMVKPND